MRLRIVGIASPGVPNQERVHLFVDADTDAAFYVLMAGLSGPNGTVTAGTRAAYWFPQTLLKTGDNVIVYTGSGQPVHRVRPQGGTDHFYYWQMPQTIFHLPNACVVLAELNEWQTGGR
jgi:hypothetical protein